VKRSKMDGAEPARKEEVMSWEGHVVTSQGAVILGVFGAAILSEAQECARRVERSTGFPAYVHSCFFKVKPSVGQSVPYLVRGVRSGEERRS